MKNEAISAYCDQLKAYRQSRSTDVILHRKKSVGKDEIAVALTQKTLEVLSENKNGVRQIVLDLETGDIEVNRHHMPLDYAREFMAFLRRILPR